MTVTAFAIGVASIAVADEPNASGGDLTPQVCVGYNGPDANVFRDKTFEWGYLGSWKNEPTSCPENYAYMAVAKSRGPQRSPEKISIQGLCCPLPPGILGPEKVLTKDNCPPDYVATGDAVVVKPGADPKNWEDNEHVLQCRKIDTSRFALGPPKQSWAVVEDEPMLADLGSKLLGEETAKISWARLPAAIRYGVRRRNRINWGVLSCIGDPPGSLFVGKRSRNCNGSYFSELLDRKTGAPIRLLPDCDTISDPFDPHPRCIKNAH